jgi:pyruvate dehydrogenase E1 component alpha subunit
VYKAVKYAAEKVRESGKPQFIEAITYRFRGHSMADPAKYRSAAEHEVWKARDPLPNYARRLLTEGLTAETDLEAIRKRCAAIVEEAVRFAEESPWPEEREVWEDIYV